ncbi:hypothetical protein CALVIDRAFT_536163 [Calocera viscosa TUFC12733]|uniref:DUF7053 domain-containing protein n=1 Tax=Calocera viscosa (strain TUFC12733) TaxID=1330018 RepID=A0A167ND45_CALVF|nr:hypothetical protein CALVIDRAFT_536163 [Calocera viscosa TUFC12733]
MTKTMPFPSTSILRILHSPKDLMLLSPGVVSATQSAIDPSVWIFETQSKHLWGLYTATARYESTYVATDNGSNFHVTAALGVSTVGAWRCDAVDPPEQPTEETRSNATKWTKVTETATITGPSALMGMIVSIRKKSHEELLKRLEERIRSDEANAVGP